MVSHREVISIGWGNSLEIEVIARLGRCLDMIHMSKEAQKDRKYQAVWTLIR